MLVFYDVRHTIAALGCACQLLEHFLSMSFAPLNSGILIPYLGPDIELIDLKMILKLSTFLVQNIENVAIDLIHRVLLAHFVVVYDHFGGLRYSSEAVHQSQ